MTKDEIKSKFGELYKIGDNIIQPVEKWTVSDLNGIKTAHLKVCLAYTKNKENYNSLVLSEIKGFKKTIHETDLFLEIVYFRI